MRFTFFLTLLWCKSYLYSQNIELNALIVNSDRFCNYDLKQFSIVKKLINRDSIIFVFQDTNCVFNKTIELNGGKYLFKVKSASASLTEALFEIGSTIHKIDLGTLILANNTKQIDEVTITGVPKKFILIDPEKTVVTVENNPVLESSTLYDAIIKIPGIIPAPGGGFTYTGQPAGVFFEGIPSSLSQQDLDNLLRSLPATAVKKIELITNPGASYDANFSGAIIDIISHDKSFKWISGSINMNVGFNKNLKILPSFVLNGKIKKITWNIQSNYSNQESDLENLSSRVYTFSDSLGELGTNRREFYLNQFFSVRGNLTSRLSKKSTLQLNAGLGRSMSDLNGTSNINSADSLILPFTSTYTSEGQGFSWDIGSKYKLQIDTFNRKLEIAANYSHNEFEGLRINRQEELQTRFSGIQNINGTNRFVSRFDLELPFKNKTTQFNVGAKLAYFSANNQGLYRFNDSIEPDWSSANFSFSLPFTYEENNLAFYSEYKQRFGKQFSFTLGLRAEDFRLKGFVNFFPSVNRTFQNLFPSIHLLYRPWSDFKITMSYARKINMPNYAMYDPNISGYFDSYTQNTGNNLLDPNFLHRSQLKFSIFDYLQLNVTHVFSNSVNISEVFVDSNTLNVNYSYRTYRNVQAWSGFLSIPVPFGFFTKGVSFFKEAVDIDAISFMYLYTNIDKSFIPAYDYVNGNNAQLRFGLYSQFILPLKIRMNVNYNVSGKGMNQISQQTEAIHRLELVMSRDFFDRKWRASFSVQDFLNSDKSIASIVYRPLIVNSYSKWDTRVIWLKLSYSFGKYDRPQNKEKAIPEGLGT
jgi:hypothetical protein